MAASYDDAVAALYQAPHEAFVAERKRLSAELKNDGDKLGSARLAKRGRPTLSAWSVNQLWWRARDAFVELFETAKPLRGGGLTAAGAHRTAIAKLRARAGKILEEAGHAATEATLRRVTTTLAALAVTGSFDPDPPGALAADRDPPGFEAVGIFAATPGTLAEPRVQKHEHAASSKQGAPLDPTAVTAEESKPRAAPSQRKLAEARRRQRAEEARQKAEIVAERRRVEKEHAKRQAERHRLEVALRAAKEKLRSCQRELDRLQDELSQAEGSVQAAQSLVEDLETRLGAI